MNFDLVILWTSLLIGFACLQQTIEYLQLKTQWSEEGIWKWSNLRREYDGNAVVQKIVDLLLETRPFTVMLWLRLIASAFLILQLDPNLNSASALYLLLSTLLISIRFRGPFNGGSDYMTVAVLTTLVIALLFRDSEAVVRIAFIYLKIQLVFSFFRAGFVKLKKRSWRTGAELQNILNSHLFEIPSRLRNLSSLTARAASWFVILFELLFPLSLINASFASPLIICAVLFQLFNVYLFGLNRFVFAWLAAYPALYFLS